MKRSRITVISTFLPHWILNPAFPSAIETNLRCSRTKAAPRDQSTTLSNQPRTLVNLKSNFLIITVSIRVSGLDMAKEMRFTNPIMTARQGRVRIIMKKAGSTMVRITRQSMQGLANRPEMFSTRVIHWVRGSTAPRYLIMEVFCLILQRALS